VTERNGRGRNALFGAPQLAEHPAPAVAGGGGRRALYSAPPRRRGCVVVECERCSAHTPVPIPDLWTLLPAIWLPIPGRRYTRLLRCPSCHGLAWGRIAWRTLLSG